MPPIPRDVDELKTQIREAVATIDNASLGHILTMNILETIKDIKTHLVNSESL